MPARAISSGTISFGLVSIPVKLFTAASSEQVHFNMLHKKCGSRLKMQYHCPTDNEVVPREDTMRGYEHARGQYVKFEEDELKALETERNNAIEIAEFVPAGSVDSVQVEKSYYLGPDKGGDKAYQLLSEAMHAQGKVAVGQWAARGKEQLILIRPYGKGGLIFHQLYYANEVRAFDEIDTGARFTFSDVERDLASKLIEQLSAPAFEAAKYHDSYNDRVLEAVNQKVAGQEITIAPEAPKAQIIDLFEALKKSISENAERPAQKGEATEAQLKPPAKAEAEAGGKKRSKKSAG
jgi:DNA end-binding protein Ku